MRITEKERRKAIHVGRAKARRKAVAKDVGPKRVSYTLYNKHSVLDGDSNSLAHGNDPVYAYKLRVGPRYRYYARIDRTSHLFNPLDVEYNKREGEPQFMELREKPFLLYLSFLSTHNRHLLCAAQHEQ